MEFDKTAVQFLMAFLQGSVSQITVDRILIYCIYIMTPIRTYTTCKLVVNTYTYHSKIMTDHKRFSDSKNNLVTDNDTI